MSMTALPRIGIVTDEAVPELTDDGQALLSALRERGFATRAVVWSDSGVDWTAFDALLVRSAGLSPAQSSGWESHV